MALLGTLSGCGLWGVWGDGLAEEGRMEVEEVGVAVDHQGASPSGESGRGRVAGSRGGSEGGGGCGTEFPQGGPGEGGRGRVAM